MSDAGSGDWDALERRVSGRDASAAAPASSSLPAAAPIAMADYRRAWFLSLIRQGRAAEAAGRPALAAHCRARVEAELATLAAAASTAPDAGTPLPAASPLAELAARRGSAARAGLAELLARHGGRLSDAERGSFHAALEAALAAAPGAASAKTGETGETPDARISELRRRLVDRLLRASRYRRQGARLAGWAERKPAAPGMQPTGPYNDYVALEETLRRIAAIGPGGAAWAAEFFDVYGAMDTVRRMYGELLPGAAKG